MLTTYKICKVTHFYMCVKSVQLAAAGGVSDNYTFACQSNRGFCSCNRCFCIYNQFCSLAVTAGGVKTCLWLFQGDQTSFVVAEFIIVVIENKGALVNITALQVRLGQVRYGKVKNGLGNYCETSLGADTQSDGGFYAPKVQVG